MPEQDIPFNSTIASEYRDRKFSNALGIGERKNWQRIRYFTEEAISKVWAENRLQTFGNEHYILVDSPNKQKKDTLANEGQISDTITKKDPRQK